MHGLAGANSCHQLQNSAVRTQQHCINLLVMTQVYTWSSGTYEGEVLDGLRHGCGRLTLADSGVMYEGQWRHGKRHGRGVLSYNSDCTAYYEGKQLHATANPAQSGASTRLHYRCILVFAYSCLGLGWLPCRCCTKLTCRAVATLQALGQCLHSIVGRWHHAIYMPSSMS
jgi:hypothetical protein